ncbi:hypothetical protein P3T76_011716 [Phytophthora citrophthora]|uniref:RxLR effector protein n=1 Tax=Phytophthora citrophthora TaxID=4793 RepID=A0AAD9G8P7_9STRA|nr:hypothetical protein P3T76_011716 [Phytophthora citrophthora]
MRLGIIVLLVLLLVASVGGRSEASTTANNTLLRKEGESTDPTDSVIQIHEEREAGAAGVFGTVVKAVQAKAKLNIMLGRGFSPSKVMKKMKITSLKDKKFNNFARYYARYLAKYPKKAATLPATAEDVAMLVKMKGWIKERVFPQQAEQKMLAFGQSNPRKYLPQYMSMWSKNQADLAAKFKIKHIKKVK